MRTNCAETQSERNLGAIQGRRRVSPIRNVDDPAPEELPACRLWEARLEQELADLREIIAGLEQELKERDGE